MEEKLSSLLKTAEGGRLLREGIRTAIAGPPNVGKSSLLNTLLGYDRAIVSNIAGTTRDTVEESIQLAGLALRLIDTAGMRESSDVIEQAGITRTNRALETADLVLEVADASIPRVKDFTAPALTAPPAAYSEQVRPGSPSGLEGRARHPVFLRHRGRKKGIGGSHCPGLCLLPARRNGQLPGSHQCPPPA